MWKKPSPISINMDRSIQMLLSAKPWEISNTSPKMSIQQPSTSTLPRVLPMEVNLGWGLKWGSVLINYMHADRLELRNWPVINTLSRERGRSVHNHPDCLTICSFLGIPFISSVLFFLYSIANHIHFFDDDKITDKFLYKAHRTNTVCQVPKNLKY